MGQCFGVLLLLLLTCMHRKWFILEYPNTSEAHINRELGRWRNRSCGRAWPLTRTWPSEPRLWKLGKPVGSCNPSSGKVELGKSLEFSLCRQEVVWPILSLALRFFRVLLWMFPSSLLLAAVCYLGQEHPVSLAGIGLQGGGSYEGCDDEQ